MASVEFLNYASVFLSVKWAWSYSSYLSDKDVVRVNELIGIKHLVLAHTGAYVSVSYCY